MTFSSVVKKPGQKKVTPKTAPRRNVQRSRPTAPPSLTPDSLTSSPAVEVAEDDTTSQNTEPVQAQTVLESTEIPSIVESVETSLPLSNPLETSNRERITEPSNVTANTPLSVPVEITAPGSTSTGVTIIHPVHETTWESRSNTIPTIAASTAPVRSTRKSTGAPTPSAASVETARQDEDLTDTGCQSPTDSRKRRKITHTVHELVESRAQTTPPPSDDIPLLLRASPQRRRSESRTSEVLLQDATSQLAAISELANSIEQRARSLRPRSMRLSYSETEDVGEGDTEAQAGSPEETSLESMAKKRSQRKQSRAKRIRELAEQVVENAVDGTPKTRRKARLPTPENADELQIDPEEVSMGDLTRDNKVGRKSETEKRMQENWTDIQKRRKEDVERRREAAGKGRAGRQELFQDALVEPIQVPKQIIVNGQIIVANESREVAFGAGVEQAADNDQEVALEDDRIYRYVNQGTLGKRAGLNRRTKWDDESTELFYKGLRMFGTDFAMIANLFPSFDRRQIKSKFVIEERLNPVRVKDSVDAKEAVNLEEYAKMSDQQFEDPAKLMEELAAEEKRLREEDKRRREGDGYVLEGADVPLPSTETDFEQGDNTLEGDGTVTAAGVHRERISTLADSAAAGSAVPKKKQAPQHRATKEPVGRGRQAKKGRRPTEGVEEALGPIDEVGR
ncbi:hypothetical protein PV08_05585 [Exophiala spinifera]|uniref:Myb-like domain-containing protein n=1 Tax=Exophiala spinifera TaxID=91928 RepID=A0A0D1ZRZ5_9EURO|nr:uncharacterized protein PV08_05585 [Exophiala spinifera]KIW15537.1 hypothetical protein PV08_05585 [Exophiala spinifera]